ncbi:MAG TPA: histidine phosphatase family protein [Lapillicoccus sp.]|nr:histidine phosphatase family protein [Lapillicoccus sp.]
MRLLLIRHAETTANAERLLDTAPPGTDLSERGRIQAEELVEALAEVPLDAIYVSDLVRTQQTAAPLAAERGLPPLVRPGVREIQAGEYEMAPDDGSWGAYLAVLYRWADGEPDTRVPGGESGTEVLARFDAVVAEAANHEAAAIVSHGAMIRAWTGARAANVDRAFVADTRLHNTAVIVLDGSPDSGWRVETWANEPVPQLD